MVQGSADSLAKKLARRKRTQPDPARRERTGRDCIASSGAERRLTDRAALGGLEGALWQVREDVT